MTVLFAVAMIIGANFPGFVGLVVAVGLVMGMAVVAALWGATLALRFKTQAAAPLMQSVMLALILSTTAYAPQELLTGWLATVAEINPITNVVEGARQGFVGDVTWAGTWPAIVSLVGFAVVLGAFALRGMRRTAY